MSDNITPETLPNEQGVSSLDSGGAVSDTSGAADNHVAQLLSEALGKTFEDKETALKAVKDTFSYVGKHKEFDETISSLTTRLGTDQEGVFKLMEQLQNSGSEPKPVAATPQNAELNELQAIKQDLEDMKFFKQNPNLEKHETLLKEIRGTSNKSYSDIVQSEVFKSTLDKLESHDELESRKSVLKPNSRLGKATNKLDDSAKALKEGNFEAAKDSAVGAVVDLIGK